MEKTFNISVEIENIEEFHFDENEYLRNIIKKTYEKKCFDEVYIYQIISIVQYSICTIDLAVSINPIVNVKFNAIVGIIRVGDIIFDADLKYFETGGFIGGRSSINKFIGELNYKKDPIIEDRNLFIIVTSEMDVLKKQLIVQLTDSVEPNNKILREIISSNLKIPLMVIYAKHSPFSECITTITIPYSKKIMNIKYLFSDDDRSINKIVMEKIHNQIKSLNDHIEKLNKADKKIIESFFDIFSSNKPDRHYVSIHDSMKKIEKMCGIESIGGEKSDLVKEIDEPAAAVKEKFWIVIYLHLHNKKNWLLAAIEFLDGYKGDKVNMNKLKKLYDQ